MLARVKCLSAPYDIPESPSPHNSNLHWHIAALLHSLLCIPSQGQQSIVQLLRRASIVRKSENERKNKHSPVSQQLCHSSGAWTAVGTTGQLDLRKETAAKTNSILGCRSRNSQEISALMRPHLDTASCFATRNTRTET